MPAGDEVREVVLERRRVLDHVLELLLVLEVAVGVVVALLREEEVVLAVERERGDRVGHAHRREAGLRL
jgi:hypothetical protein